MIYAKVDVKLRDHIRAQRAGVAMATWTWGLLYVREQETDGVIHAEALERSWCPKEAKAHAATLVLVGLWEKHEEGWRICRYEDKNDTKQVIAENRQRVRDRVAQFRRNSPRNALPTEDVTRYSSVSNAAVPGSRSSSRSRSSSGSSGEEIKSPEASPSARDPFAPGDASAFEARARYTDAVKLSTGEGFVLGRAPFHTADLCDLLNGHAPAGSKLAALEWLATTIPEWIGNAEPAFTKGYAPSKLNDWLNAKRPKRYEKTKNAAEITKQGFDENAPWMKVGT